MPYSEREKREYCRGIDKWLEMCKRNDIEGMYKMETKMLDECKRTGKIPGIVNYVLSNLSDEQLKKIFERFESIEFY